MNKRVIILFFLAILAIAIAYFSFEGSYQNSFQARVYFFLAKYEEAKTYAKKAYDQNPYNKMAFYILTQSKIALNYEEYIKRGTKYLENIEKISQKEKITIQDKSRIKFMCEIMKDEYKNLPLSRLIDDKLKMQAKEINHKFAKIFDELF